MFQAEMAWHNGEGNNDNLATKQRKPGLYTHRGLMDYWKQVCRQVADEVLGNGEISNIIQDAPWEFSHQIPLPSLPLTSSSSMHPHPTATPQQVVFHHYFLATPVLLLPWPVKKGLLCSLTCMTKLEVSEVTREWHNVRERHRKR